MSQISRKNSFGKVVFPFLVGNFMSRDRNWFFGRHFVIVYPILIFFPVFWFFWITLSVARISPPNSFGKVLFWVRVHRDPPPPWPLVTWIPWPLKYDFRKRSWLCKTAYAITTWDIWIEKWGSTKTGKHGTNALLHGHQCVE